MIDQTDGRAYLSYVLEKIESRLASIDESLVKGQKEIEDMHHPDNVVHIYIISEEIIFSCFYIMYFPENRYKLLHDWM